MQANCPDCDGKKVSIMVVSGQSRDPVKRDGRLRVMHVPNERDHIFFITLPPDPDEMLNHAFPEKIKTPRSEEKDATAWGKGHSIATPIHATALRQRLQV